MAVEVPAICKEIPAALPREMWRCQVCGGELVQRRTCLICLTCRNEYGPRSGRHYVRRCLICQNVFLTRQLHQFLCGSNCARFRRNARARSSEEADGVSDV
jgi:hypothetical protein